MSGYQFPNAVPPLSLPAPQDPSRLTDNMVALNRWSLSVSPLMFFVGTPLVGSNPPAFPSNAYAWGSDNPTVPVSAGVATVTFDTAFPNGIMYLSVQNPNGSITADVFSYGSTTLEGFTLYSSLAGTGTVQVSYLVLGW